MNCPMCESGFYCEVHDRPSATPTRQDRIMTVTALAHTPFVAMLEHFMENGQTANERELAKVALDMYLLAASHQSIMSYVDQYALRVMQP